MNNSIFHNFICILLFLCFSTLVEAKNSNRVDSLLEINALISDDSIKISNLLTEAKYQIGWRNFDEAEALLNNADNFHSTNPNLLACICEAKGFFYYKKGFFDKAIGLFIEAEEIARKHNILHRIVSVKSRLALVYMEIDVKEGKKCYAAETMDKLREPFLLAERLNDTLLYRIGLYNFTFALFGTDTLCVNADTILFYLNKLEKIVQPQSYFEPAVLRFWGEYYYLMRKEAEAEVCLQEAVSIMEQNSNHYQTIQENKDLYLLFNIFSVLVKTYTQSKQIKKAESILKMLDNILKDMESKHNYLTGTYEREYYYKLSYDVYKQENNDKEALKYLELFHNEVGKLRDRDANYLVERWNSEILVKKQDRLLIKAHEQRNKQMKIFTAFFLLFIFIFSISLILFIINKRLRTINKKLEANKVVLAEKAKTIEDYTLLLKNENDTLDSLVQIRTTEIEAQKEEVLNIIFKSSHVINSHLVTIIGLNELLKGNLASNTFISQQIEHESQQIDDTLKDIVIQLSKYDYY